MGDSDLLTVAATVSDFNVPNMETSESAAQATLDERSLRPAGRPADRRGGHKTLNLNLRLITTNEFIFFGMCSCVRGTGQHTRRPIEHSTDLGIDLRD